MSHHDSGPNYGFRYGDARLDIADVYAFSKLGEPGESILILNVHPCAGVDPPEATTSEPFATEALYELKIDTDGDSVAEITVRRIDGAQAAGFGDGGQIIVDGAPVSTGREARITGSGDYRFFASWRRDPFFCDLHGARNVLQFTAVLDVPGAIRLWARTLTPSIGADRDWIQANRGARPADCLSCR